jgi:putative ABC transport system permease protein
MSTVIAPPISAPTRFSEIPASRVRLADVMRAGFGALGTRKLRTALSALGVSIGIAALVGVLGLSASSRAALDKQLNTLGTDLLTVEPGGALGAAGGEAKLNKDAAAMVRRIGQVSTVSSIQTYGDATVRRSRFVDEAATGGITVAGADLDVLPAVRGTIAKGRWLDAASERLPTVVLGSSAAERLGITRADGTETVVIKDETFTVIGILKPLPLAKDLERTAFVGKPILRDTFGLELLPSKVYLRVPNASAVPFVRSLLAATANPAEPAAVTVSRPSDALAAQVAARTAFTSLFLGLGAVSLLAGAIGIANVMVISVIERRGEIGLRRAIGATRPHISQQFLIEAVILSALGGLVGIVLGSVATGVYAHSKKWAVVVPPSAFALGLGGAMVIGALAGLFPAIRAARLAPTEALRRG